MPEINLVDFFTYFTGTPEQLESVQLLQQSMPDSLLKNKAAWVMKYREKPEKEETKGVVITSDLMARLTGYAAHKFPQSFCDDFNRLLSDTGFDVYPDASRMLMANILHETANTTALKEWASGEAYEFRSDLGNTKPGDGPKYKGAGCLMLTGRYNYSRAATLLRDPKILELGCDYVAEVYPFSSALMWIDDNNLLDICIYEGFKACCFRINGGWNGLGDRLAKYEICKREMR